MAVFAVPTEILSKLGLKQDMIAADLGCGSGGWVIPLASFLDEGKIYAVDIQEEPLSALAGRLKLQHISNVEILQADIEKEVQRISPNSCDLVLLTNLLFQVENKKAVLEEAKRILKPGGRVLIIDWKPDSSLGPENKISPEEIKKIAEEQGLKLDQSINAGDYHYGLIFKK